MSDTDRPKGLKGLFVLQRNVVTLSVSVTIMTIAMYAWYPVLPLYLRQIGASDAQVGLTYTLMAAAVALPQLLGGILSDRFGRKWPITGPTFLFAALYLTMHLVHSWFAVTACMFFISLSGAFQRPAFNSMLAESVPDRQRGASFGTFEFAAMLGVTLGPFLGAALLPVVGTANLIFGSAVGSLIGATIRAMYLREPTAVRAAVAPSSAAGDRHRPQIGWYIVVATAFLLMGNLTINGPFMALHASDSLGMTAEQVNILAAIGGIGMTVAALAGGRLVDRLGERRVLSASVLIHVAAILIWASLSAGVPGVAALFVAAACLESSAVANSALMVSLAPPRSRGMVLGIIGTISGFSAALAPTVGTAVRGQWGSAAPFWSATAMAVVVTLALLKVRSANRGS